MSVYMSDTIYYFQVHKNTFVSTNTLSFLSIVVLLCKPVRYVNLVHVSDRARTLIKRVKDNGGSAVKLFQNWLHCHLHLPGCGLIITFKSDRTTALTTDSIRWVQVFRLIFFSFLFLFFCATTFFILFYS